MKCPKCNKKMRHLSYSSIFGEMFACDCGYRKNDQATVAKCKRWGIPISQHIVYPDSKTRPKHVSVRNYLEIKRKYREAKI